MSHTSALSKLLHARRDGSVRAAKLLPYHLKDVHHILCVYKIYRTFLHVSSLSKLIRSATVHPQRRRRERASERDTRCSAARPEHKPGPTTGAGHPHIVESLQYKMVEFHKKEKKEKKKTILEHSRDEALQGGCGGNELRLWVEPPSLCARLPKGTGAFPLSPPPGVDMLRCCSIELNNNLKP